MGDGTESRRVFLSDSRDGDRYLRVTWHPTSQTVVFSHWSGDVCVASSPVRIEDAGSLVGLLVDAVRTSAPVGSAPDSTTALDTALDRRAQSEGREAG